MIYIALLRGINVGGKNKVSMSQLKAAFEQAGMVSVTTYINSGNVIFQDDAHQPTILIEILEAAFKKEFGFFIKVVLHDIEVMNAIIKTLPNTWKNDDMTKCDVIFLSESVDNPAIISQLKVKPGIDDVRYVPGALLWRVDRDKVTRSGLLKIVGTELYKHTTIRNCNTARKLLERMNDIKDASTNATLTL